MAEAEVVTKVWGWLAALATALGLASLGGVFSMRDRGRDHQLRLSQLEAWVDSINRNASETRDIAIETRAELEHVHEAVKRIESNLAACQAVRLRRGVD
jgi:hypothetical protein